MCVFLDNGLMTAELDKFVTKLQTKFKTTTKLVCYSLSSQTACLVAFKIDQSAFFLKNYCSMSAAIIKIKIVKEESVIVEWMDFFVL